MGYTTNRYLTAWERDGASDWSAFTGVNAVWGERRIADALAARQGKALMVEFSELTKRIDRLSARAAGASDDAQLLSDIEDALAVGYLKALNGEAESRRLGERLERLVETVDEAATAVEVRRIALQRRSLDQRTAELRAQLSVMREHFSRLSGGHSAHG